MDETTTAKIHETSSNPVEPELQLKSQPTPSAEQALHPQKAPMEEDSAVTKAEKVERYGLDDTVEESPAKRIRLETENGSELQKASAPRERQKGVAPIKAESVALFRMIEHRAHPVPDFSCILWAT